VRGVLALLLIPALNAISAAGSLLHTHAYTDHDHPEHHHGLAAHEHRGMPAHPLDGTARLEGCDPARHAIAIGATCVTPAQGHAAGAEAIVPSSADPALRIERLARLSDVRVHGPPFRAHASTRAPPLIAHA
jgi:hypothetical protein